MQAAILLLQSKVRTTTKTIEDHKEDLKTVYPLFGLTKKGLCPEDIENRLIPMYEQELKDYKQALTVMSENRPFDYETMDFAFDQLETSHIINIKKVITGCSITLTDTGAFVEKNGLSTNVDVNKIKYISAEDAAKLIIEQLENSIHFTDKD